MGSSIVLLASVLLLLNGHRSFSAPESGAKSKVHIVYLGERQHNDTDLITQMHHQMLASVLGSKEAAVDSMLYSYRHGFSGFAAKLTQSQAQEISSLFGVISVIPNHRYTLKTTRSWDYLGQYTNSNSNLLHKTNMGEDIIVGVLDSGVWPESKAYNDKGIGPIPKRWKGRCESGDHFNVKKHCNRKLIGAKWFIDGLLAESDLKNISVSDIRPDYLSSRDGGGHGTHTSSTAAGSIINNANYKGIISGQVRGGAPKARIAMYKVAWEVGCSAADVLMAFDEAIHDGVDLLSVSLGAEHIPLYSHVDTRDIVAIGSFHAVARGIPVICAAGNEGPYAMTVLNTPPWTLTVAATTTDRSFPTQITLGNKMTMMGQSLFSGKETDFVSLVSAEEFDRVVPKHSLFDMSSNESLPSASSDAPVKPKVVLFFNVVTNFHELPKILNQPGVIGLILAQNPDSIMPPSLPTDYPFAMVDYELGTRILTYIHTARSPKIKLSPTKSLVSRHVTTKVAHYSCRGPNSVAPAILKPDIAAPGSSILAASAPSDSHYSNGFALKSGTSMATPHMAGIVALLRAVHPDWSPAAIKSALVTTASKTDPFGELIFAEGSPKKLADPFDYGGGLVNPDKAADPGLVYDMGTNDYINYLCSLGYNVTSISVASQQMTKCPRPNPSILDVNVPSITIPNLRNSVTLTRTVTNVGPIKSTYKALIEPPLGITVNVRPDTLVFDSTSKTLPFMLTVSTSHKANTWYYFGSLIWTDGIHNVTIPISVRTQVVKFTVDDY